MSETTTRLAGARADKAGVPGALILGGAHGSLAVARSLGRRGIPVWFLTHDHPIARFSRYVGKSLSWPGPRDDGALDLILKLARDHDLSGWVLFASGDAEVCFVAQHHAELSAVFRVTTPDWSVTQFAGDKHLTYQRAEAVGVRYPKSYSPKDRSEVASLACQFPVILKPAARQQGNAFTLAKAWRADNRDELLARYDAAASLVGHDMIVLQEFVPGSGKNQFSYAAVYERGVPVASMVARRARQYPIDFGFTSTFVEVIEKRDVEDAAECFLGSLGYDGIVELEFKYDDRDGAYKLLDFNARPWTWLGLGATAGVDFPWLLWQLATGAKLQACRAKPGATWMYLSRDVVSALQNIAAGKISLKDYFASLRWPMALAAFAWDDPMPGLIDFPLTLFRALVVRLPATLRSGTGAASDDDALDPEFEPRRTFRPTP